MSGFFGMVREDGKLVETRFLDKIAEKLIFRGPDGKNVWARDNVGGCFTWMRTGPAQQAVQQPVKWGDRFWLWGDLRLDGREELRKQLAENDCTVDKDATSEELLLRAWTKWGAGCLDRVIGDFSFALWDDKEEKLWCAKDFVGPRPLYYLHARGVFCFTNTMEILQVVPEASSELDEAFLGDFLTLGWNAELTRTVYRDIRRVAPGHVLKFSKAGVEVRRFRSLPIEEPVQLKCAEEYLEAYRDRLKTAVQDRLSDDPTALYLSGGLDSSSVCAVAAQIAGAHGQKEKLKAFTLSWQAFFDDPEPGLAKITAGYIGIAHEILEETHLTPFEGVETGEVRLPEPGYEVFFARERRQSQSIAAHSNVVLSGDGGDDVLTGQGWPYLLYLWRKGNWKEIAQEFGGYSWTHKRIPPLRGGFRSRLRRLFKKKNSFVGYPDWINPEFAARTNLRQKWLESKERKHSQEHPFHPEAYAALHDGYWSEVLEVEDAGWNHVRLETRAPLLDLRVLTFLLSLPPVPWCLNKEICRRAMRDALPTALLERPKTPLVRDPLEVCAEQREWIDKLPREPPDGVKKFVNWDKWCETLYHSKGSLSWMILRPASLLHWLKAVENDRGIK